MLRYGESTGDRRKRSILAPSATRDLFVYGDESHEGKQKRVFAVGGLLGSDEDWGPVEAAWIGRTGGRIFHAKDCDSDQGEYKCTDHSENKLLYRDLTLLIATSKLIGFGSALSIKDYRDAFPHDLTDHPYHVCFLDALKYFTQVSRLSIPPGVSRFIFHRRHETEYNASEIYGYFCKLSEWKPFMGDSVSFESDASARVQAADLVARESMKHLDNSLTSNRPRRQSFITLQDTRRFVFIEYRRDSFEMMKERRAELGSAADFPDYHQWRAGLKLDDNMTARVRYLNAVDPAGRFGTRWG
jgi:hypothetical protein